MEIDFVKEQFELAKKSSHLSETVVIDVKTVEWLIGMVEHLLEDSFKQSRKYQLLLDNWLEANR